MHVVGGPGGLLDHSNFGFDIHSPFLESLTCPYVHVRDLIGTTY